MPSKRPNAIHRCQHRSGYCYVGWYSVKTPTHDEDDHSTYAVTYFDDNDVLLRVERNELTGLYDCPCGRPEHSRVNRRKMKELLRLRDHSQGNPHQDVSRDAYPGTQRLLPRFPGSLDLSLASSSGTAAIDEDPEDVYEETTAPDDDDPVPPLGYDTGSSSQTLALAASPAVGDGPDPSPAVAASSCSRPSSPLPVDLSDLTDDPEDYSESAGVRAQEVPEEEAEEVKESRAFLQRYGIYVEKSYRRIVCADCRVMVSYDWAYGHREANHERPRKKTSVVHRLPPRAEFYAQLDVLQANIPVPFPQAPIHSLDGVEIHLGGHKCLIPDCPQPWRVYGAQRAMDKHFQFVHSSPLRRLQQKDVPCHQIERFRTSKPNFVEVFPVTGETSDILNAIVAHAKSKGLGVVSLQFMSGKNVRQLDPLLAQAKWLDLVQDVNIVSLRDTAIAPTAREAALFKLPPLVREYYTFAASRISSLSTITLRYIHSPLPSQDLKSIPFHRPQLDDTVVNDADYMASFISFLIRHKACSLEGFPVPLHDNLARLLDRLVAGLVGDELDKEGMLEIVHLVVWALLEENSPEAKVDEKRDLFNLFLLASHIIDDHGRFCAVQRIPPDISKLQWCFRATASEQVHRLRPRHNNEDLTAYEQDVGKFVTDGRSGLFTVLRQRQKFFSALALAQPGIPRISWDFARTIVTIDGFPIPVRRFIAAVKSGLADLEAAMWDICEGMDLGPILEYVTRRLDHSPEKCATWMRDDSRENVDGYSFIENRQNDLGRFKMALLDHFGKRGTFCFLQGGQLMGRPDHIFQFLEKLDAIVRLAFFLVTMTSGGTPRGTECEGLRFANSSAGNRHVVFFNGLLGVVTTYSKTQTRKGHAAAILRSPPAVLSRLLVVLWTVLYPCASYLITLISTTSTLGDNYTKFMYVTSGHVMDSKALSAALAEHTDGRLQLKMGHRDVRQLIDSMLKKLIGPSFGDGDDDSQLLGAVDAQTNHSTAIAQQHYSIDYGAIDDLADTQISEHQRVSLRWHIILDVAPKQTKKEMALAKQANPASPTKSLLEQVLPLIETAVQSRELEWNKRMDSEIRSISDNLCSSLRHPYVDSIVFPPVEVHPRLVELLQAIHPELPDLQWNTPEQAEVLQLLADGVSYHILFVCPTGGGKTALLIAAAMMFAKFGKVLLVVTPLVATTHDLYRRVRSAGVTVANWAERITKGVDASCSMIVVSAHLVNTEEFKTYCRCNQANIQGIAIDEAHEICISSYRNTFEYFVHLTRLGKPFLFLSATILPQSESALCTKLEVDKRMLRVFRLPTYRPNISYRVEVVANGKAGSRRLEVLMKEMGLEPGEKGLVYCLTTAEVEAIAKKNGLLYYHANVDPLDENRNSTMKESAHDCWMRSDAPEHAWMVCTLAFGLGIDHPRVRYCVHLGMPPLLRFIQESGRLGRTGKPAYSMVLQYKRFAHPPNVEDVHIARTEALAYVSTKGCRRLVLGVFDGTRRSSCGAIPNALLCDNCEEKKEETSTRVIQPINMFIPTLDGRLLNHDVHAERLRNELGQGRSLVGRIQVILKEIAGHNCPECWLVSRTSPKTRLPPPHKHKPHPSIPGLAKIADALAGVKFPRYVHWPFCYRCWITFEPPSNHRRHEPRKEIDPTSCPNERILPAVIAILFAVGDERRSYRAILGRKMGVEWVNIGSFLQWLAGDCSHAGDIPNIYKFLLAFDDMYPSRNVV